MTHAPIRPPLVPGQPFPAAQQPTMYFIGVTTHQSSIMQVRLEEIRQLHQRLDADLPVEYHHTPTPELTDRLMAGLPPGSLVINATGLGKDAPGSPLTDNACWPTDGIAWDFNYRGDLVFLRQARAQQQAKRLRIEDGWIYFLHGWTRVIAEVFHIDIPTSGPRFDELSRLAASTR